MVKKFMKLERGFKITKQLSDDGTFEGYASVFDTEDHHGDTIARGAFTKGLKKLASEGKKLKMLFSHDPTQPIGVFKSADEDSDGLWVEGKLTLGVQKADETRLLMLDGAIDAMSIGGYVIDDSWNEKTMTRTLKEIELREVSPVVFPALDDARIVSVKSLRDGASIGEVEKYLRDVGHSRSDAKRLISIIKGVTFQRDADSSLEKLKNVLDSINKR